MKRAALLTCLIVLGCSCFTAPARGQEFHCLDEGVNPTVPIVFNGVPFLYHGVDRWVTQEPEGEYPMPEVIPMDSSTWLFVVNRIHLITYCSWSLDVPTGTEVGFVLVHLYDGGTEYLPLLAGVNTAEWAYDRPEASTCLQHDRIRDREAYSWWTSQDSQFEYAAHNYYSSWDLSDCLVTSLELCMGLGVTEVDCGTPCWTPGKHNVGISAVTLQGYGVVPSRGLTWGRLKSLYR